MCAAPAFHLDPPPRQAGHLIVGCTGSVIAGLMPQTLLSLVLSGFQERLDVILTETAQRFLARSLLESYGIRCWADGFERQDGIRVPHVNLAASADLICVLPATADALDRLARSACSDLLSLAVAASAAPVVICPAMNQAMWANPGIQRNVRRLREDGHFVMEPAVLFAAADFGAGARLGYGGHGTLWAGPGVLMQALSAVLDFARGETQGSDGQ
nr:flavoprotein [Mangrovicoccus sp. HB161399]